MPNYQYEPVASKQPAHVGQWFYLFRLWYTFRVDGIEYVGSIHYITSNQFRRNAAFHEIDEIATNLSRASHGTRFYYYDLVQERGSN